MKLLCLLVSSFFCIQSKTQSIHKLLFKKISGSWITAEEKNGSLIGETWSQQNDTTMLGQSFMITNGDTTILETVTLVKNINGIFYIPVAYGQNGDTPVPFKLTVVKNNAYYFTNYNHDFPRRIVYEFSGNKSVHAFIDDGTAAKRQHYNYVRKR